MAAFAPVRVRHVLVGLVRGGAAGGSVRAARRAPAEQRAAQPRAQRAHIVDGLGVGLVPGVHRLALPGRAAAGTAVLRAVRPRPRRVVGRVGRVAQPRLQRQRLLRRAAGQ